jgi:hypothetical protein
MESGRFSSRTRSFLESAGWHASRSRPVDSEVRILRTEGYDVPTPVLDLLREFGGLKVTYPHAKVPAHDDNFVIDAELAMRGTFKAWIDEYQRRVGATTLTPVGQAARGYLVLVMADTGTVYAGYDDTLLIVGESADQAIENLCSGANLPEVP